MPRSRMFVATVLALALVPNTGVAAPAAAPAANPAQPAPATTPTDPNTTATPEAPPTDAPPTDAATPEGETPTDAVPVEEPKTEEPPPEAAAPPVPEGPERPPEPMLGNGKFKAKGTGLMIAGGTLLGLGIAGVLTTYFLTHCPEGEVDKSFACSNRQHKTFAIPATATVALMGAVLLIVGLSYRGKYKKWENWDPNRAKTALRPHIGGSGIGFKF